MKIEEKIQNQFVIPVIRSHDPEQVELIIEALFHGGFKVQEVTLMTPEIIPLIGKLKKRLGLTLGAGTVLDPQQAQAALDEGAEFLVSPGFSREVSSFAHQSSQLYIPGVMTPTEVMKAQQCGHRLMKLFPFASLGGVSYLKNLEAPFPEVKWLLSGGIKAHEVQNYRLKAVSCVALGQDLFPMDLVQSKSWDKITELAQECLSRVVQI